MKKRLVDTEIWISEISDMVKSGYEVPLSVTGNSMLPFLKHDRDRVILSRFSGNAAKGDILLYRRSDGQYIMHRVVAVQNNKLWLAGDFHGVAEGPIGTDTVIARVIKAERNGKWISADSKEWKLYADLSHMPLALKRVISKLFP